MGKPRLFLINACRGNRSVVNKKAVKVPLDTDGPNYAVPYHPDENTLLVQSSTPEYVSYRDERSGSLFITAMCEVLNGHKYTRRGFSVDDWVYGTKSKVSK